jgi:predicted DNA-binding transcriptional regulator AlpA
VLRHVEGPDSEWLELSAVATYLHLGVPTLRRLIAAKKFPAGVRHGGIGKLVWHWLTVVSFAHLGSLLPREWSTPPARSKRSHTREAKQGPEK